MAFDFLLWHCLDPGKTSVSESGKSARLKPKGGECVLLFKIDSARFRAEFEIERVCDALFFYKSEHKAPVLLFVELKGTDVESAIDQLDQTLKSVRNKLDNEANCLAVVACSGSTPKHLGKLRKRFQKQHGITFRIGGPKEDLRKYV